MKTSLLITKAQVKVFSAVFSNFVVLWLGALFVTQDAFALLLNLLYAGICWKLAVKAEELLDEL